MRSDIWLGCGKQTKRDNEINIVWRYKGPTFGFIRNCERQQSLVLQLGTHKPYGAIIMPCVCPVSHKIHDPHCQLHNTKRHRYDLSPPVRMFLSPNLVATDLRKLRLDIAESYILGLFDCKRSCTGRIGIARSQSNYIATL